MIVSQKDLNSRPLITVKQVFNSLLSREICHNGKRTNLSMTKGIISVGCTDITIEAAMYIIECYERNFKYNEPVVTIQ